MNATAAHGASGRLDPALIVVLAGVSAALHIGKLPPALPALRAALGVTLVQAGFLLSLVQFAGMAFGIFIGLAADTLGLRRSMLGGLLVLSLAGFAGGFATAAAPLLMLRAVEGFGFLLAVMPAPGLIRRLVTGARLNGMLGVWGAYMPLGTALALLCGPVVIVQAGWPAWWWLIATLSLLMAVWLWRAVPTDAARARPARNGAPVPSWRARLALTLGTRGPWLVALCFAVYSAQWIALIGFLPSIYAAAGLGSAATGALTALAAAVNIVGNVAAGRLLQRGARPQWLLWAGFAAMALGAFATFGEFGGASLPPALRYAGVLLFSMLGGLIPGTLFALAVQRAPSEGTVSTTVGWMQQWSAIGQFLGPPAVAWLAAASGGWHWTWLVTGGCALLGMLLAAALAAPPATAAPMEPSLAAGVDRGTRAR